MWALLPQVNIKVVLAVTIINVCIGTIYYFSALKPKYMRLMQASRQRAAFTSSELPLHPLRSLVGTAAAAAVLTTALNLLALRFGVNSWQDGLCMAGALLLIDICLNARHHFFERRPTGLFLLHCGYQTLVLVSTCCLLCVFGWLPA
ncbi:sodium p-type atpase [Micractinium conductrix]|uniref:Sodium p-type atpase n=1 Tax=Micractinium conductrix TaxID=554055 RepID=A0A2P6VPA3_9CHLO|nr:sodium p-type atpase [Micractinium conductrix]|eukprot:PSC75928.1 sodium p-type atpase [Micractinium conductrix]